MIRVQNFGMEYYIPVLSGMLQEKTTKETYKLINAVITLVPPSEARQDTYLLLSALEQFYNIYSHMSLVPKLTIDTLISTIRNNIYEELKENKHAGFRNYAASQCGVDLDVTNDEILGTVEATLIQSISEALYEAKSMNYTVEESASELISFQINFNNELLNEAGRLIEMMSNGDLNKVNLHFWGWSYFLSRHRIYSSKQAASLFNLLSDHIRSKVNWVESQSAPMTSMSQFNALKEQFIEDLTPFITTPFDAFNEVIKMTRGRTTVIVADKGGGKTTWASVMSAAVLAQEKRVLFYSPESPSGDLYIGNILPAYVKIKYGFSVTGEQVVGVEPPYEAGSKFSQEEKTAIINLAIRELTLSGNYMHVEEYVMYKTMEEDFRAKVKAFNPDFIVWDHTQEVRGDASSQEKTSRVATMLKSIAKEFRPHVLILSHPGSKFKDAIPTVENPVSKNTKIAAYSNDVETLADNIVGVINEGNDLLRMFFTKLRKKVIPPMFQSYRMIKPHCWFDYRPEDQYTLTTDTNERIQALLDGSAIIEPDMEENEELEEEGTVNW